MKYKLLLFLIALSITGCSLEELWHEGRSDAGRAFSVEQAREFFEKDYADMLTRSQGDDTRAGRFRGRMYPGDFTPLWDKAEYSESDGAAAFVLSPFPIIAGTLGVASGIVGIVSACFSYNIQSGIYINNSISA